MKRVLVLTHVENEGPGTLGFFLNSLGVRIRTIRLYEGESPPGDASKYDAIISMGGPMNVDEEDRYPFLSKEVKFLKRAIDSNVPVIGICLGAQLITKACCAKVERMAEEERGWKRVFLTDEGRRDILFQGLPGIIQVFQWHGYTFDIPYGGELIATAKDCPNQAFRYRNAYGLQFHIEVTGNMIREWFNDHPELEDYMDNYQIIEHEYYVQAKQIYANFMWFADLCRQSSDRRIKLGK